MCIVCDVFGVCRVCLRIANARVTVIAACAHIGRGDFPIIAAPRATVISSCARIERDDWPMHRKYACDHHRDMRDHCNLRIADASHVRVGPSSHHACSSRSLNRRCIASARLAVIAAYAHIASVELPMHRTCAWNRHRNMRAHQTRRIADASQLRVRPSSQSMRVDCKRCVTNAPHVGPSWKHAHTLHALDRRCIAIVRVTVIAACAHIASGASPMHRKCACDRHRNLRAH